MAPKRRSGLLNGCASLQVEQRPPAPLLMGRHLLEMGLPPGPRIGEITQAVYEMQMDNRVRTLPEAKAAAQKIDRKYVAQQ